MKKTDAKHRRKKTRRVFKKRKISGLTAIILVCSAWIMVSVPFYFKMHAENSRLSVESQNLTRDIDNLSSAISELNSEIADLNTRERVLGILEGQVWDNSDNVTYYGD